MAKLMTRLTLSPDASTAKQKDANATKQNPPAAAAAAGAKNVNGPLASPSGLKTL
jgi:hypothetical protein